MSRKSYAVVLVNTVGTGAPGSPECLVFILTGESQEEAERRAAAAIYRRMPGSTGVWVVQSSGELTSFHPVPLPEGITVSDGAPRSAVYWEFHSRRLEPSQPGVSPSWPSAETPE